MSIKQTLRKINWYRQYYTKNISILPSFWWYLILNKILPSRSNNYDLSKVKKILLIRNDRIGDMVATTPMIRHLANAGYEVYITSSTNALDVIKYNPFIKGVFVYNQKNILDKLNALRKLRRAKFDLAIECRPLYTWEMKTFDFIYYSLIPSPILMGVNRENINSYNATYKHTFSNEHFTDLLNLHLDFLGIKHPSNKYELYINNEIENYSNKYKPSNRYILINPFGSASHREMTINQIQFLSFFFKKIGYQIVITGQANKLTPLQSIGLTTFPSRTVLDIIPIIREASFVITVDTSIIHFATAFSTPTIALYLEPIPHIEKDFPEALKLYLRNRLKQNKKNYIDKIFGKDAHCAHNLPNNSIYWAPNNPNATQIIFQYENFKSIPETEFSNKLNSVLLSLFNYQKN